jgi:hypothetical protein
MRRSAALALWAIGVCCASAQAVVIDFTSLSPGTAVTNQYPAATFSSIANEENRVQNDFNFGGNSFPNYICTATVGGELDCSNPVYVDFTSPVGGLTFYTLGDDVAATPASVDVYSGANLLATVPIVVDGNFNTIELVDLTAYAGVTRIEISANTDINGLAYDTFSFEVPEPAVGMAVGGAMLVSAVVRRRRGV